MSLANNKKHSGQQRQPLAPAAAVGKPWKSKEDGSFAMEFRTDDRDRNKQKTANDFVDIPLNKKTTPRKQALQHPPTPGTTTTKSHFAGNQFFLLMDQDDKWLQQNNDRDERQDDTSIATLATNGTDSIDASAANNTPLRINGRSNESVPSLIRSKRTRRTKPPTKIDPIPLPLPPVLVMTVTTPVVWETTRCSGHKPRKNRSINQQHKQKRNQQQNKIVKAIDPMSNDDASWPPLESCNPTPTQQSK
ncbi:hypothetical protein SEMRO_2092_G314050.1 [Seminavis robusta]|uniref:Uncharacterized protein n=1 Tax=Seminavis robusta TaxID=568900 RepID=A0A9N8EYE9_9STRA|nr:hypothetical protein SEMRO_2092_G314050.1 [Seminavis robusta]|eukprot:Sro2092_g314050.1 n/a (248) ;mRNA; r:1591-2432